MFAFRREREKEERRKEKERKEREGKKGKGNKQKPLYIKALVEFPPLAVFCEGCHASWTGRGNTIYCYIAV